jgi:predicted enzyme related to lactoylglutathione lyase
MPATHGQFVWYELMTPDTAAAEKFYATIMGWTPSEVSGGPMPYTLFSVGDAPSAGMMAQMEDARKAGVPPSWPGYVHVDDVDATAAKAIQLGGKSHHGPTDIPGVCRFAVLADPQSAVFGVMKWVSPGPGDAPARAPMSRGFAGWHELMADDWPTEFDFYAALLGWTKGDAVDIGEMGTYQLFAAGAGAVGGMFNKPAAVPVPFWLYYVCVGPIAEAVERVTSAGGKILIGPMEVPGGAWIVQCTDPQGATFALLGSGPA